MLIDPCTYMYMYSILFPIQLHDERSIIGKSLFKRETNIQAFVGLKVKLSTGIFERVATYVLVCVHIHFFFTVVAGEEGIIEGSFGTSGKFRVNIPG